MRSFRLFKGYSQRNGNYSGLKMLFLQYLKVKREKAELKQREREIAKICWFYGKGIKV